jgi:hypothetical protein
MHSSAALQEAVEWLCAHQSPNGSWDCDGFKANCGHVAAGKACGGGGEATHDVGITGLALLALLGAEAGGADAAPKEAIAKAIQWLVEKQDPSLGIYGERIGNSFLYGHAIATLAMSEAASADPARLESAKSAVQFLLRARNSASGWRYAYPPAGDCDTSVTGWCMLALARAREAGVAVDFDGLAGVREWFEEKTDAATGRTGYDDTGSLSARVKGVNDDYSVDRSEAMTAISLRVRPLLDKRWSKNPLLKKQVELVSSVPPEWDASGLRNDVYTWYHGSCALAPVGGKPWDAWKKALVKTLTDSQVHEDDAKGSWDPRDAWGHSGGRVYMTAMAALCLEEAFRAR